MRTCYTLRIYSTKILKACLSWLSLREIDIELMRRLSPRVNVIPVIGRADSLTPQELKDFKRRVCFQTTSNTENKYR